MDWAYTFRSEPDDTEGPAVKEVEEPTFSQQRFLEETVAPPEPSQAPETGLSDAQAETDTPSDAPASDDALGSDVS